MNWWNILIFGVVPILTVVIIFIFNRKILWTVPLVSIVLAFTTYMIALAPISIVDIFSNHEWRGFFLLAILMHLGISVVLTVIAYLMAYIIKRKQK